MAELTGQTFAGFEVVAKLGQGGMGAVYKARQPLLDRFVALKVMSQQLSGDSSYVARFIREAASAAKLSHPNMVQVHTAGEQGGIYYIVMEFVEGESLSQRLKRVGALDPVEAIAITLYVAQALQVAWNKARLIHRDIKPDNIFLSKDGEVKVGDLGLAKSVTEGATDMTQSGMMMGSPHYMSPEQARASKETDFRTDIYSLGCTLYQLLAGMTPYQADDALGVILKHVNNPAPDLQAIMPNCPPALVALVGRMMAKDRNARHASYEELIAELWQVSDLIGQQQSAPTAVMTPPPAPAAATVKPTVVKAATVVPTVKQMADGESKAATRDSRFVISGAVALAALLLAGLFLWSPWKKPGSAGILPAGSEDAANVPSQAQLSQKAGRMPAFPGASSSSDSAIPSSGILAPSETRVAALTTTPKVGEVFTLQLGSNVTMELMGIPPGEFMLGSTKEEQQWAREIGLKEDMLKREGMAPRKAVIKQGFWMGRTEVTRVQWRLFADETGYVTDGEKAGWSNVDQGFNKSFAPVTGKNWRDPGFTIRSQDNHPVSCISWNDAVAFCKWMTQQQQKMGRLPPNAVVRLPTEAEWEYACRAGTQSRYWWGDSPDDGKGRLNWYGTFVAPVNSFSSRGRNGFGLADMLGNVNEWCLDKWDATQAREDLSTADRSYHPLRGGAFCFFPTNARCAFRSCNDHSGSFNRNGFRVVVGVDVEDASKVASLAPMSVSKEGTILAPPETRVAALTATPKVGEVYTLPLGSNVTMELMGIPPGEFMMGSTKEERAWALANRAAEEYVKPEGEAPRRTTIKRGFWLGRTEVTIGQWKQFVKDAGYISDAEKKGKADWVPGNLAMKTTGKSWRDPGFGSVPQDRDAVCCVSWNDAKAFCEWLSGRERRAGRLPQGCEIRLPMEAEWEYACRAGTQTKFWWGESEDDGRNRLNWAGKDDGFEIVAPVDSYGARGRNGFGLADMLGNVYEWCLDGFDATQAHEDLWTGNPDMRVLRGGAFNPGIAPCRCAHRRSRKSAGSDSHDGFRVCVGVAR